MTETLKTTDLPDDVAVDRAMCCPAMAASIARAWCLNSLYAINSGRGRTGNRDKQALWNFVNRVDISVTQGVAAGSTTVHCCPGNWVFRALHELAISAAGDRLISYGTVRMSWSLGRLLVIHIQHADEELQG